MSDDKQALADNVLDEAWASGVVLSARELAQKLGVSSSSTGNRFKRSWESRMLSRQEKLFDELGFSSDFTQAFMREISRFSAKVKQDHTYLSSSLGSDNADLMLELDQALKDKGDYKGLTEKLQSDVDGLNSELKGLAQENKFKIESQKKDFEHRIENLKVQNQVEREAGQEQHKALESKNNELATTIEALRRELAQADVRLNDLKQFETKNIALQDQVDALKTDLGDKVAMNTGLQKELEAALDKLITAQDSHNREVELLRREVGALRDAKESSDSLTVQLREELAGAVAAKDIFSKQMAEMSTKPAQKNKDGGTD